MVPEWFGPQPCPARDSSWRFYVTIWRKVLAPDALVCENKGMRTATTAQPTRPIAPVQPADLRWMIENANTYMRTIDKILVHGRGQGAHLIPGLVADHSAALDLIKEWYTTAEGQARLAAVDEYNAQAKVWNAWLKSEERARKIENQARKNTRETAAVRAGACARCMATHAGEC
jgi:hypothetical protein